MLALALRRMLIVPFQILGVVTVVFFLVRLLPNPAYELAGPVATRQEIQHIQQNLGLSEPLPVQYVKYILRVLHGDLGRSWYTGNTVLTDIAQRGPATLELITFALIGIVVFGLLAAGVMAVGRRSLGGRIVSLYGFVAGALPDFWIGLAFIFVFYYKWGLAAAPSGQANPGSIVPAVTRVRLIDALLAGNGSAVLDAMNHLVLPVLTLVIVYSGPVVRVTAAAAAKSLRSDFIEFATAWGIAPWRRTFYALRDVMPQFVVIVGATYGYLLGGAVLVETVFAWGGLGQYAVQGIMNSDYAAVEGFVMVAGVFTIVVYAVTDLVHLALDPRIAR